MKYYFAPLEGVTDVYYRQVHHRFFPGIEKYFTPFISTTREMCFSQRERSGFDPVLNAGIPTVPQILTHDADEFVQMCRLLRDLGYTEVNLNLGCPSGTVTAKGKGSGMLRDPNALAAFLDRIFACPVLPVSVKTRIGWEDPAEWELLAGLMGRYPFSEAIVHFRTRREYYKGKPHAELLEMTKESFSCPVIYNGDLHTVGDVAAFAQTYAPETLMLGRGLIVNPVLHEARVPGKEELRAFHDALLDLYASVWPDKAVPGHMHEIMKYMAAGFRDPAKALKQIRKADTAARYRQCSRMMFDTCEIRTDGTIDSAGGW